MMTVSNFIMPREFTHIHKMMLIVGIIMLNIAHGCAKERFKGWEKRETEIVQQFFNDQQDKGDEMLKEWLLSDAGVVDYPFDILQERFFFHKVVSPDKKLCVFTWNKMIHRTDYYGNVIYYWTPAGFKTLDYCLWQAGGTDEKEVLERGCFTQSIYQLEDNDGRTIYLARNFLNAYSSYTYTSLDAFVIENNTLCTVKDMFVKSDGETDCQLGCAHYLTDWRNKIGNVDTYYQYLIYGEQPHEILCPISDEYENLIDKYEHYIYNGRQFVFKGNVEGKELHPSLSGFESLEQLYDVDKYYVRVDRMKDGTYRYASWKREKMPNGILDMGLEPNIVVTGGYIDGEEEYYVFPNGSYEYRTNTNPSDVYELLLAKNGRITCFWNKVVD